MGRERCSGCAATGAQEHTGGVVGTSTKIRCNDVESAIAVDITQAHGGWTSPYGEVCFGSKGAIAIAQQHAGIIRARIRSNDVEFAIAVDIAQVHRSWSSSYGEVCFGSKGAIAIAQEHTGGVGTNTKIRSDYIESAIAVHIAQSHGSWTSPCGEVSFDLKGAIAIAQEHTGGVGTKIRSDYIEDAIAVHIARCYGEWSSSRGEGSLSSK